MSDALKLGRCFRNIKKLDLWLQQRTMLDIYKDGENGESMKSLTSWV